MSSSATCSSPRRSRSHSTSTSPTNPSSKRAFSAASPRNMIPTGKRARRGSSSSARPPSIIIPIASSSGPFSALPAATPLSVIPTNFASSAPSTPLFPSTSTAFFPSAHSSQPEVEPDTNMQSLPPTSPRNLRTSLDALHREAFTSLRQSVAESGEGFVRRMREWEQRRHTESSKAPILGNERDRDKRRDRWGGRRSRATRVDQRTIGASISHVESYRSSPPESYRRSGRDRAMTRGAISFGQHDETDDEDDMMNGASHTPRVNHSQKKRRPASVGDVAMDVITSPELFNIEIADSDEIYPATRFTSTLDFPFTYSNMRSSSPFSFANTSDDDSSSCSRHGQTHSGFSSPRSIHHSVDWAAADVSTRSRTGISSISQFLRPAERVENFSPGTSPLSNSPMSSHPCVSLSPQYHTNIRASVNSSTPTSSSGPYQSLNSPQTASEKAVAALVLALSNGSGSLADYGSVREAQGDLEELEAGALWE